jgi:hypothetical protein
MGDMTTITHLDSTTVLASGRVAYIGSTGRAELATCTWLVAVPTASLYPAEAEWYPDSPADVYTEVVCGAPVYAVDGDLDHTRCPNGHEHLTYGSPAQVAQERLEAMVEHAATTTPWIAARLDAGDSWEQVMAV